MSNPLPPNEQDTDKPFSPEALAALGKARRSFGVSIAILLLGFMAIGFAIVYRVMRDAPPSAVAETVSIPAGSEVVFAVLSDGAINVTYSSGGVTTLEIFDRATGALVQSVVIGAE